jgi:hypothetical protein
MFMLISLPRKSKLKAAFAGVPKVEARPRPSAFPISLYRILACFVIAGIFAAAVPRATAQGRPEVKRPDQTPAEKPPEPKKKKVKGPRAIGLLQFDAKGKTTLIPIAIQVEGKFYDAAAYKADPIPMALESGVVYEAEQTGDPDGLFTVAGALHSKNPGSAHPWFGSGTYLPPGAEPAKTAHKAENVPVGIDSSGDEPPRLTRKDAAQAAADAGAKPTGTSPSTGSASTGANEKPAEKSADASSVGPSAGDKSAGSSTSSAKPDGEKQSAPQTATSTTAAAAEKPGDKSSGNSDDNYYKPTLRRGKPTQAAPDEDDSPAPQPVHSGTASNSSAPTSSNGTQVRVVPAISDAGGPDPQSYKFFWKTGEEDEKRNQMLAVAANEVRVYALELAKNHITQTPVTPQAAVKRRTAAKDSKPVFDNVQFHGYDLWLNNQLVMVLTADATIPGWTEPGADAQPYHLTLVARTDIYGDIKKMYSGITDKFHLDVTPQLELIDAVDADGDGRGEFLFRETADAGSGYIIYRATPDKLWKLFDSLNAE